MNDQPGVVASHNNAVRVYFEDTDAGGIVYYANYLKYIERARTELLRDLGIESSQLMRDYGIAFAVKRCSVEYHKPAVLDDDLVVETKIVRVGGASLDLRQRVWRDDDLLVSGEIRLGCLELAKGKPKAMPDEIRQTLVQYAETY